MKGHDAAERPEKQAGSVPPTTNLKDPKEKQNLLSVGNVVTEFWFIVVVCLFCFF